jgi:hypothetical protein
MLGEILQRGVALAHRSARLVFFDILWKAAWLAGNAAAVLLLIAWFGSQLRGLAWEDSGIPAVNGLIAATLAREFWSANRIGLLLAVTVGFVASATAWFLLEAWFRRKFVTPGPSYRAFLLPHVATSLILAAVAILLLPVFFHGASILAAIIFVTLAFCLSLVETLIRAGAVELAGTDLIRVIGLVGILMSFELMIAASMGLLLIAGFLNVARLVDALVMLGVTGLAVVFLTILHSYLLLVRFSAIAIMRQNAVEI